ncbi:hypothetical protein BDV25DRAFT_156769 [Aspergillus avenaceus]|uniref:Fungal STAND N-terminal Goodbye domain-containing protein n=1 Tax=Aspergillus avenaceus TaxID=36643 RepID=A0A5N6TS67_ASPAV|nr:hypothetical protein BDV25DRAFT_156769 [Aspergillus avenaceus]
MGSIGSEATLSLKDSWQQAMESFNEKTRLTLVQDGGFDDMSLEDLQNKIIHLRTDRKTSESMEKIKQQSQNIVTALQKLGGIAVGGASMV